MPRRGVDVGSVGSAFTSLAGGLNSLGALGLLGGFYAFGVLDGWLNKALWVCLRFLAGLMCTEKKSLLRSHFDWGLRCRAPKSRLSTFLCFDSWRGSEGKWCS